MKRIIYILLLLCCSIAASAQNPDPELLKKAQAGDAKAQYELFKFYLPYFNSVSAEGIKWLTKAAENGNARAQWELENAFLRGWYGIDKDSEKYVYWLKKAANNTDLENYKWEIASAQNDLGILYERGEHGVEKNISEFLKWEKKAAYKDYNPAAFSLGLYYKQEGDKQEAIYWFKKAMDIEWAERHEEHEFSFEHLRELGVTYHPADHVGHNHAESTAASSSTTSSQYGNVSIPNAMPIQPLNGSYGDYSAPLQTSTPGTNSSTHTRGHSCKKCQGSGKCTTCYGEHRYINPLTNTYVTCPNCTPNGACPRCGGSGQEP
ncbi:MAG: hypothetical protein K2N28_07725 [Muribaculaceae bacterium]|nr:hypothetical protein [Muribaculaceae bacterium]